MELWSSPVRFKAATLSPLPHAENKEPIIQNPKPKEESYAKKQKIDFIFDASNHSMNETMNETLDMLRDHTSEETMQETGNEINGSITRKVAQESGKEKTTNFMEANGKGVQKEERKDNAKESTKSIASIRSSDGGTNKSRIGVRNVGNASVVAAGSSSVQSIAAPALNKQLDQVIPVVEGSSLRPISNLRPPISVAAVLADDSYGAFAKGKSGKVVTPKVKLTKKSVASLGTSVSSTSLMEKTSTNSAFFSNLQTPLNQSAVNQSFEEADAALRPIFPSRNNQNNVSTPFAKTHKLVGSSPSPIVSRSIAVSPKSIISSELDGKAAHSRLITSLAAASDLKKTISDSSLDEITKVRSERDDALKLAELMTQECEYVRGLHREKENLLNSQQKENMRLIQLLASSQPIVRDSKFEDFTPLNQSLSKSSLHDTIDAQALFVKFADQVSAQISQSSKEQNSRIAELMQIVSKSSTHADDTKLSEWELTKQKLEGQIKETELLGTFNFEKLRGEKEVLEERLKIVENHMHQFSQVEKKDEENKPTDLKVASALREEVFTTLVTKIDDLKNHIAEKTLLNAAHVSELLISEQRASSTQLAESLNRNLANYENGNQAKLGAYFEHLLLNLPALFSSQLQLIIASIFEKLESELALRFEQIFSSHKNLHELLEHAVDGSTYLKTEFSEVQNSLQKVFDTLLRLEATEQNDLLKALQSEIVEKNNSILLKLDNFSCSLVNNLNEQNSRLSSFHDRSAVMHEQTQVVLSGLESKLNTFQFTFDDSQKKLCDEKLDLVSRIESISGLIASLASKQSLSFEMNHSIQQEIQHVLGDKKTSFELNPILVAEAIGKHLTGLFENIQASLLSTVNKKDALIQDLLASEKVVLCGGFTEQSKRALLKLNRVTELTNSLLANRVVGDLEWIERNQLIKLRDCVFLLYQDLSNLLIYFDSKEEPLNLSGITSESSATSIFGSACKQSVLELQNVLQELTELAETMFPLDNSANAKLVHILFLLKGFTLSLPVMLSTHLFSDKGKDTPITFDRKSVIPEKRSFCLDMFNCFLIFFLTLIVILAFYTGYLYLTNPRLLENIRCRLEATHCKHKPF